MGDKRRRLSAVLSRGELRRLILEGLNNDEIGERFGFSGKTVSAYVRKWWPEFSGSRKRLLEGIEKVKDELCVRCFEQKPTDESGLCLSCQAAVAHGADLLDAPGRDEIERVDELEWQTKQDGAEDLVEYMRMPVDPQALEPEAVTERERQPAEGVTSGIEELEKWMEEHPVGVGDGSYTLERLELLARVKEAEDEVQYWRTQAVHLAVVLDDVQAERVVEMNLLAQQLQEVGVLLNRANLEPLLQRFGLTLVVEPQQLEEAVQAWTGERLLVVRDVVTG